MSGYCLSLVVTASQRTSSESEGPARAKQLETEESGELIEGSRVMMTSGGGDQKGVISQRETNDSERLGVISPLLKGYFQKLGHQW